MISIGIFNLNSQAKPETSTTVSQTLETIPGGVNVVLGENSPGYTAEGEIISTQTVSSKTRTVETITVS